jgi:stage V sporulation protein B
MNKTQKGFVAGAAILGGMGIISKIFGAVYTIITTNVVGTIGMAHYMTAFPVYTFLLAISSAGLPVAISKMVAERVTLLDYKAAHMVFRTAIKAMVFIGFLTTVVMIGFSRSIANALGRPEAYLTIMCIAPSLFFVAILSAYRGYFQGMQRMAPTAFSQIIEQIVKLGAGLLLAFMWIPKGPEYGAAGAILGITVSEVFAFLYLLFLYNRRKVRMQENIRHSVRSRLRVRLGNKLFILAMPIIIGACAMPLVQMADTAIISNTLLGMKSIVLFGNEIVNTGADMWSKVVDSLYGLTGYVNPIINMPAVFSTALAMSLVPAISASKVEGDDYGVANKAGVGLKLAMLIGLPCAAGLYLLATPIINLLYAGLSNANADPALQHLHLLSTTGNLLGIMALGVFFLTILQTMTGILQGLGKTYVPVINLFIGIGVKIAVSLIFIRMPEVNIQGAFIGTVACYAVAAVLDVACVVHYTRMRIKVMDNFIKPLLAAGTMSLIVHFIMPDGPTQSYPRLITLATVALAIVLYIVFIFLFGALNETDLKYIPGGRKLAKLFAKLRPRKSLNRA